MGVAVGVARRALGVQVGTGEGRVVGTGDRSAVGGGVATTAVAVGTGVRVGIGDGAARGAFAITGLGFATRSAAAGTAFCSAHATSAKNIATATITFSRVICCQTCPTSRNWTTRPPNSRRSSRCDQFTMRRLMPGAGFSAATERGSGLDMAGNCQSRLANRPNSSRRVDYLRAAAYRTWVMTCRDVGLAASNYRMCQESDTAWRKTANERNETGSAIGHAQAETREHNSQTYEPKNQALICSGSL